VPGASNDLLIRSRSVLLDALAALGAHRDAVVVIGAQAVYLRAGKVDVALAEATKDSDVALDPRRLVDDPRVEEAMRAAGFLPAESGQPGAWVDKDGIPVDLMVPERFAGSGGRRGARIPPHSRTAARRASGLEAVLIDHGEMEISALAPDDRRVVTALVAGPGALLVCKLHKLGERVDSPGRLNDKDAHDIYRLLRAVSTADLAGAFGRLLDDEVSEAVTLRAIDWMKELFAAGPQGLGSRMAGRAEDGIGDPEEVSASVAFLADDLARSLS
jgi:hypothetical protein